MRERIEAGKVGAYQCDVFDAGDESAQPQSGPLVGEHSVDGAEGERFDVWDAVERADEEPDVVVLLQPSRVERDDEYGRGGIVLLHAPDGCADGSPVAVPEAEGGSQHRCRAGGDLSLSGRRAIRLGVQG
ncbi:hypothetical protein ACH4OW_25490 [Streptomyces sp. NPDC017056]|uniref:hypothetical protein n=1 Tax=Streptomyces sp. NPDC017056 TaxID=3364973 RepID=UPI0037A4C60A